MIALFDGSKCYGPCRVCVVLLCFLDSDVDFRVVVGGLASGMADFSQVLLVPASQEQHDLLYDQSKSNCSCDYILLVGRCFDAAVN